MMAGLFSVINGVLKPIVTILALPAILLTLGLFTLIVNGFMVYISLALAPGFLWLLRIQLLPGLYWGLVNYIISSCWFCSGKKEEVICRIDTIFTVRDGSPYDDYHQFCCSNEAGRRFGSSEVSLLVADLIKLVWCNYCFALIFIAIDFGNMICGIAKIGEWNLSLDNSSWNRFARLKVSSKDVNKRLRKIEKELICA